jgi:hypothetical protein
LFASTGRKPEYCFDGVFPKPGRVSMRSAGISAMVRRREERKRRARKEKRAMMKD